MSTTDRARERGQALVIFAFGLVGILAVAALVFDVGQDLLDRRDRQNASDAAALAGARYLTDAGCKGVYTVGACTRAVEAARALAKANGFEHGVGGAVVEVKIPPGPESAFRNTPGHIEVRIRNTRPTFFGALLGITQHQVTAMGVAANIKNFSIGASFLSLDEHACQAGHIGGNGTVNVGGSLHVNSDCASGALQGAGSNITLNAPECTVVGDYHANTKSDVMCGGVLHNVTEGAPAMPDPLASIQGPYWGSVPYPQATVTLQGAKPSVGCPDGKSPETTTSATLAAPKLCDIGAKDGIYRIYPGIYPGGIRIAGNTSGPPKVYIEPGIYYIAGGGLRITGGPAEIMTVDAGGTTAGGGILIYNTEDPVFHEQCAANPAFTWNGASPCLASIHIGGNSSGRIYMEPYEHDPYRNLLIYQERSIMPHPQSWANLEIDGTNKVVQLTGTIYVPEAEVKITGNGDSISTQVISNTWKIAGNGEVNITYDANSLVKLTSTGLVE